MYVRHGEPRGNGGQIVYTIRVSPPGAPFGVFTPTILLVSLASDGELGSNLFNQINVLEGTSLECEATKVASVGQSPRMITVTCRWTPS